jgi:hypothetical protein
MESRTKSKDLSRGIAAPAVRVLVCVAPDGIYPGPAGRPALPPWGAIPSGARIPLGRVGISHLTSQISNFRSEIALACLQQPLPLVLTANLLVNPVLVGTFPRFVAGRCTDCTAACLSALHLCIRGNRGKYSERNSRRVPCNASRHISWRTSCRSAIRPKRSCHNQYKQLMDELPVSPSPKNGKAVSLQSVAVIELW